MHDSLRQLFTSTGALFWVLAALFVALLLLALVVDYGLRSLRWLIGLPRGSGIWQEPDEDRDVAPAKPEAHFPSWVESDASKAPLASPVASHAAWAAGEVPMAPPKPQEGA